MKWVVIGTAVFFTARALACWLRASKTRPALLEDIKGYLEQIHDAAALMDELIDRYPQWREDDQLALNAKLVEEVGTGAAKQLMNMVFGMPLKALERLEVLSYVLELGVQEFQDRAEELYLLEKPSRTS